MRKCAICSTSATQRRGGRVKKKHKPRIHQRCKKLNMPLINQFGSSQCVYYAIVNTDLNMDQGTTAAMIARGLILLHSKMESDYVKVQYIDDWITSGQKIIILKGFDDKHLKYLCEEAKFLAIGIHRLYKTRGRRRVILVLSVFGQEGNLEDIFEGLSYLQ